MGKTFRDWDIEQLMMFPPSVEDFVPQGHVAHFVRSTVSEALDLSAIVDCYNEERGYPPYHPVMMTALVLYAYCQGIYPSRRIAKACRERVDFMAVTGMQTPDFRTISDFRKRHMAALGALFVQVLRLCQEAGLVKLGHVALDGTKIKANASKHKAMSYGRMCAAERQLEQEVAALLAQAQQVDADEEAQYGAGRRGDELPAELARRESRLAKIRAAKAALEQEAQARAAEHAEAARAKRAERAAQEAASGKQAAGRAPTVPDPAQARPEPTAQRNFIDPDSRIMKDGATKSFAQAYNAQAAVDEHVQIVVATAVIQEANDKQQLVPMIEQVAANCGAWPAQVSADAGYFSEANVTAPQLAGVELYVPPDRQQHGAAAPQTSEPLAPDAPVIAQMRHKLQTPEGHDVYA